MGSSLCPRSTSTASCIALGLPQEKIASIAVPLRSEQRVIGCLNLVYMASAMTIEQAAEKHLPALQRVAKQIEEGVESQAILVAGRRSGMHLR